MYQENSEEELKAMQTYGFGNQRSGVFARLQVSLCVVRTASHLVCRFRDLFPGWQCQILFALEYCFQRGGLRSTELVSLSCELNLNLNFFKLIKKKNICMCVFANFANRPNRRS